jgi:hypothetical protein
MTLEEKIAECLDKKIDEVEEYTGLHGDDLAKEIMKLIKENINKEQIKQVLLDWLAVILISEHPVKFVHVGVEKIVKEFMRGWE